MAFAISGGVGRAALKREMLELNTQFAVVTVIHDNDFHCSVHTTVVVQYLIVMTQGREAVDAVVARAVIDLGKAHQRNTH